MIEFFAGLHLTNPGTKTRRLLTPRFITNLFEWPDDLSFTDKVREMAGFIPAEMVRRMKLAADRGTQAQVIERPINAFDYEAFLWLDFAGAPRIYRSKIQQVDALPASEANPRSITLMSMRGIFGGLVNALADDIEAVGGLTFMVPTRIIETLGMTVPITETASQLVEQATTRVLRQHFVTPDEMVIPANDQEANPAVKDAVVQ